MTSEQAKSEESQQGSIGIRHDGVDGIDERRMIKLVEQLDKDYKQGTDGQMSMLTQALIISPTLDIHAIAGGE
jgi:hypothetical protein